MKQIKTISIKCDCKDFLKLEDMTVMQGNLKERNDTDYEKIKKSILTYSFSFPFFIWKSGKTNYLIDGTGRHSCLLRMQEEGYIIPDLPVVYISCKDKKDAKQKLLRLNSQYGKMTKESVLEFAEDIDLNFDEIALPDTTIDFSESEEVDMENAGGGQNKLTELFLVPPLSILDTTQGYWQERKRIWKSIGLKSEEGRDDKMMESLSALSKKASNTVMSDESIFDPVLCEILYSWFCKEGGQILDPFAGGSVRGIVANYKKMKYTGFDIRQEQIDANNEQKAICKKENPLPVWICADSNTMEKHLAEDFEADFVFSCPPYADLEVYSEIEGDISNMEYSDFLKVYTSIIKKACDRLKENRFACFTVCEVRNKKGFYHNFVCDTIKAFENAGLNYYNEIILKNGIGTKRMTCGIGMRKTRKVGKIHQNVLVFCKGDPKKAVEYLGDIQVMDLGEDEDFS